MTKGEQGPDEIIATALTRIRRDQQKRHLQRRAAEGDSAAASASNAARYRYLDALDGSRTALPISEIADAIGVDRPRASRLTTQLLDEGYIEREPAPGDSRYALIRLTSLGEEFVAGIQESRRRGVAEALADFTAPDARTLAELLTRFIDAWPRTGTSGAAPRTSGRLAGVTVDCQDPQRLAGFWSAVLDGRVTESLPGWRRVTVTGGELLLTFQPVPEPKVGKARLHLDIAVADVGEAVDLIGELGGRWTGERHDYPEGAVLVMADPEGNEFCIVQHYRR